MRISRGAGFLFAAALAVVLLGAGPVYAAPVTVAPGNASISAFPPAQTCTCHATLLNEWGESMHAKALEDPLFQAKVAQADAATGGKLGAFCKKCHGPVADMTGESAKALTAMEPSAAQGIGCMFCHQVVGASTPLGNVSQLLVPDLTRRAQLENPQAPHPAVFSPFHATSAICGACHNVNHPGNGMHLESTYAEWAESPQAKAGTQCQDCHMSATPGQIGPSAGSAASRSPQRPNIYQMTFSGAQVALGNADRATAMLKSAATLEVDAPAVVKPGQEASVTVKVTNSGAGHYLPTGLTEVREMWLSVSTVDGTGKSTVVGEHRFGTELQDAKGKHPVELWDAVAVYSDDRIPPTQSVFHSYKLIVPDTAYAGTLKAQLLYRSAPESLAIAAGVQNPTTVMASSERPLFGSSEAQQKTSQSAQPVSERSGNWGVLAFVIAAALGAVGVLFWWRRRAT